MPAEEPTGIGPDRAVVDRLDDDTAVLLVGPARTPLHVEAAELPADARVGTWVILDVQSTPPLVIGTDGDLTDRGSTDPGATHPGADDPGATDR